MLHRQLEQDPAQVAVLNNKAAVYMEMGDLDQAEKQCEDAVEKARALRPTPFEVISKIFVRWGKVLGSAYTSCQSRVRAFNPSTVSCTTLSVHQYAELVS